jgi:hypothetical protein
MRKLLMMSFLTIIAVCFVVSAGLAVKPGEEVNPNGFPSGPHYNLNIIGKKVGFTCPGLEYDEYGQPIYGNVIFIPENDNGIEIYMQSGKGKKAEAIPELQVIDPCATDGTKAVMQLPKNDAGYRVYARALATPTGTRRIATSPELVTVRDENGNILVFMGTLSANGFETSDGYIYRKKGKSRALDITRLFQWAGDVCSIDEPFEDGLTLTQYCAGDPDGDGNTDFILLPDTGVCPDDYPDPYNLYCKTYPETWVFNIGAFVEYLWSMNNEGVKLLQIRFYPNGK